MMPLILMIIGIYEELLDELKILSKNNANPLKEQSVGTTVPQLSLTHPFSSCSLQRIIAHSIIALVHALHHLTQNSHAHLVHLRNH